MGRSKCLIIVVAAILISLHGFSQRLSNELLLQNLAALDNNSVLPASGKLQLLYSWKQQSESLDLPMDSVYARLLHKIGVLEFFVTKNYNAALLATTRSLQINTSGRREASSASAILDYFNIALYYDVMGLFRKALIYYDSAILKSSGMTDIDRVIPDSRTHKAYIFFRMGDYEKAVEESDLGIASALEAKDSLRYLFLLNQRAQALSYENKLPAALGDVRIAIPLAQSLRQSYYLASAYKILGFIYTKKRDLKMAEASFRKCIFERVKTRQFGQVAADYSDFGNFYSDTLKSYQQAAACYVTALQYGKNAFDSPRIARASLNLGRNYFYQKDFSRAMQYYQQAMLYLKINTPNGFPGNPSTADLLAIGNKELIQVLFNSKTELLLGLYKRTHDEKWLTACLETSLLNDSLIMDIRHEQLGEQSKLYWRDKTRDFFNNAIEACYLANNHELAFHFMETSRSVLLQDKLSELDASSFLPPAQAAQQENIQINIIALQQKIVSLPDTSAQYKMLRIQLLHAKEQLGKYVKSLEARYPHYYQLKYADKTTSLSSLQSFLAQRNQRFIDYFLQDTASFALCVTPSTTRLIRIAGIGENIEDYLIQFLRSCSDENALNSNFAGFVTKSYGIYNILFRPFRLPEGRVIICQDKYLIPFEALSKDSVKGDFLVSGYSFSYVYSARYLMEQYDTTVGERNFLGIAPVKFSSYKGLPDLDQSENALRNCSAHYTQAKLLIYDQASRRNFMQQIPLFNITTIMTHARADSMGDEPMLFLKDSVIHLSELQILNKLATKLIVLSACQTNVGKNFAGEGIFSLARGFSAAGIPSVAATQWEADERATYIITDKFHEYVSRGFNKDEALQKAKLFYLSDVKNANILPYYWSNMILIGNADPVRLSTSTAKIKWEVAAFFLAGLLFLFLFYRLKDRRK